MQPKLEIIQTVDGEMLRIIPVPTPPNTENKAKTIYYDSPHMPSLPVLYPLDDEDEARLVKALMRSTQPIKSAPDILVYGKRLSADDRAAALSTVERLNSKLLPLAGTGIVADAMGADALTFSLRFATKMWGGRAGTDLQEAATFRAGREHQGPKPVKAPLSELPPELPIAMPRVEPVAPTASKRRPPVRRAGETLQLPLGQKADLPILSLGTDATTGAQALIITPQPHDTHIKPLTIVLPRALEIQIVQALMGSTTEWANTQSFITEPLKQGVVLDAVSNINERLVAADAGMRIYRRVDRNPVTGQRDDNFTRMVLQFDDKQWIIPADEPKLRSGAPSTVRKSRSPLQRTLQFTSPVTRDMMRAARHRSGLNRQKPVAPKPEPEVQSKPQFRKRRSDAKPKEEPPLLRFMVDTVQLKVVGNAGEQPITERQAILLKALGGGAAKSPRQISNALGVNSTPTDDAVIRDEFAVIGRSLHLVSGEKVLTVNRQLVSWRTASRVRLSFGPGDTAAA